MKRLFLLLFVLSGIQITCTPKEVPDVLLINMKQEAVTLHDLMEAKKGKILIFLAPDCPLSQYYTFTLRKLFETYSSRIFFAGIIPGNYSAADEMIRFRERYLIPFELLLDKDLTLTQKLNAVITPEVFLLNEKWEVIYSGAIDDAAVDLTVKRQVARNHYLEEAIHSFLNQEPVKRSRTKAVGCIIERRK